MLRPHETVAKATAPGLETFWPNGKLFTRYIFYEISMQGDACVRLNGISTFLISSAKWPIVFCDVDGHEDGNTGTQKSGKDSKSNKNEAAQVVRWTDGHVHIHVHSMVYA